MSSHEPSPWSRRLRWVLLALMIGALPALWLSSGLFRLGVYPMIYPYLDAAKREALFKRVRNDEGRPDLAWRMYAENHDLPDAAWSEAFQECGLKGPYELAGLEDDLIAVLGEPRLQGAHLRALSAATLGRMRDPRFDAVLTPFLDDPDLAPFAAYLLALDGKAERALPILTRTLKRSKTRPGPYSSSIGGDAPYEVQLSLEALRILGAKARPATEELRHWAELEDPWAARHGLATLWILEQDEKALARLKKLFKDQGPDGDLRMQDEERRRHTAMLLAEIGQADDAALELMESWIAERPRTTVILILQLGTLGGLGAPSARILQPLIDDPNPPIREAARRALASVEGRKHL